MPLPRALWLPIAIVAFVVLSACQGPATSPRPAATGPLATADAKFFKGDYDGAEGAYRALIASGTPGAQVHYSLLLDYTNRFQEALAMARAGGGNDSYSLGRLTRAEDWAAEVPAAVEAGAMAIAARPVEPSARAFYAEALADAGQFDLARRQLVIAQATAHDSYAVAEVERDWANYFRSKGDPLEEFNHLQLSLRAQPEFPERQLELARFDYANGRSDQGAAITARIEKAHPHDYLVLVALANSAFLQGDSPGAVRLYGGALRVRPSAPAAALGLAEVDVAANRDFHGAHDLLLASLKVNSRSADVYLYLRELDLLVLNTDPVAELGDLVQALPASLVGARKTAIAAVGDYRKVGQLGGVPEDAGLDDAALAHAYYWLFNFGQASEQGVAVHTESPTLPAFTGARSSERAAHFGYRGDRTVEDIAHTYSATSAVQRWMDTVYHRFPILDAESVGAGYGEAQVGALAIQVLEVGLDRPGKSEPVLYPAPDQSSVPSLIVGGEVPEPLPTGTVYPVGYPITLSVGAGYVLHVTEAGIVDPGGTAVPFYAVVAGADSDLRPNQFALVPLVPLKPGRYRVQISGLAGTQRLQAAWQFSVAGP